MRHGRKIITITAKGHTDREIMEIRPAIIVKTKKNMHIDRHDNTSGQDVTEKEPEHRIKYKSSCIQMQRM
jgi:uncharacterized spore protein YtfJ